MAQSNQKLAHLWVRLQAIADTHADILRPKEIDNLYEAAKLIAELPEEDQNEALKDVTFHLIAAISLLESLHADLAPSKRHALFSAMIKDYKRAAEKGRAAIRWEEK